MATLADTGSTKVNENNPYTQVLGNIQTQYGTPQAAAKTQATGVLPDIGQALSPSNQIQNAKQLGSGIANAYDATNNALNNALGQAEGFAGDVGKGLDRAFLGGDQPYTPAQLGPASIAYEKSLKKQNANAIPSGPISAKEASTLPSPGDSVANTPEALSASALQAQKMALANTPAGRRAILKNKKLAPPTEEQDVVQALAPDQAILDALPAEYKTAMAGLAPYINTGNSTGNAALNAADAAVSAELGTSEGPVEAALTGLGKASTEFAKSVPNQSIIQALLGFQKYEVTQGSQPSGEANWSQSMKDIYQYISGLSPSGNGLQSPAIAANAAQQANVSAIESTTAGGGNG